VKKFAALNRTLLAAWVVFGLVALYYRLGPPPLVSLALLAIGVYFLAVGLTRPAGRKQ
jgi:hypothetical protein